MWQYLEVKLAAAATVTHTSLDPAQHDAIAVFHLVLRHTATPPVVHTQAQKYNAQT